MNVSKQWSFFISYGILILPLLKASICVDNVSYCQYSRAILIIALTCPDALNFLYYRPHQVPANRTYTTLGLQR